MELWKEYLVTNYNGQVPATLEHVLMESRLQAIMKMINRLKDVIKAGKNKVLSLMKRKKGMNPNLKTKSGMGAKMKTAKASQAARNKNFSNLDAMIKRTEEINRQNAEKLKNLQAMSKKIQSDLGISQAKMKQAVG